MNYRPCPLFRYADTDISEESGYNNLLRCTRTLAHHTTFFSFWFCLTRDDTIHAANSTRF